LHLEKPGMLIGVDQDMGRARLARGEMDMFRDFFLEAKQEPLSEQQESAMAEVIQSLKQAEQH
jgi:exonuclease SbcD